MTTPTPTAPADRRIADLMAQEAARQQRVINLIASENLPSRAVMDACGHVLQTKYAEGYPGKRYYGGCEIADQIENRVSELACEVFGTEFANVQPHSGTQANQGVYQALLQPGGKILSMDLAQGGHLSHGSKVNFSFRDYRIAHYGLGADETIDHAALEKIADEFRPDLIIAGSSTYAPTIEWERFRAVADKVGAKLMCDIAHIAGLIAGGSYPNPAKLADVMTFTTQKTLRGPRGGVIVGKAEYQKDIDRAVFPGCQGGPNLAIIAAKGIMFEEALLPSFCEYAAQVVKNARAMAAVVSERFPIVSGRTDCHMFTVKLDALTATGHEVQQALEAQDIIVIKQLTPHDARSPMKTSGIRIGTPTITTQGYDEAKCRALAERIVTIIDSAEAAAKAKQAAR
ncbi:MAG: serine hydroxymethyltransferase [Planctomycetota bacterium]